MGDFSTLTELIKTAIEKRVSELHFALPARIESYDYKKQKADVQILIKKETIDGVVDIPKLTDVPVAFQSGSGGNAFVTFPIKKGDTGLVIFSERSLDKWKASGGSVDPADSRICDLSDGIFYPGLRPFNKSLSPTDDKGLELNNGGTKIILYPDGKIYIGGATGEIVSIIADVVQQLISATVPTAIGPMPFIPSTITALTADLTKLNLIKK